MTPAARGMATTALLLLSLPLLRGPADARAGDGAPGVRIEEPQDGALVGARIKVVGRVPPLPAGAEGVLRVNRENVSVNDGRFEVELNAAADGPFRIHAVYAEIGAPASVAERSVVVDSTPPSIEIEQPEGQVGDYSEEEATVSGVARDPNLRSVRMNGRDVAFDGAGRFSEVFLLPSQGFTEIAIEATDAVGNRAEAKRVLRYVPGGASKPPEPSPGQPAGLGGGRAPGPVDDALMWLKAHQSQDGGWECEGFRRWCEGQPASSPGSDGAGKAQYDVGVTGLALLAFLGAGYTNRSDDAIFGKVVARGLRHLKDVQDAKGCFGTCGTGHYVYSHAIAARAMVKAYAMTGSTLYRIPAQQALDFIAAARNPSLAWRYGVKPGDDDTSVTGWMALALLAARDVNAADAKAGRPASFTLDEDAFAGIRAWLDKMTDPATGRVGYQTQGTGPARPTELVDKFPGEKSESMTAVAILLRSRLGEAASPALAKGADLCSRTAPRWDPSDGSIDFYYWYYATCALARTGGAARDAWNRALRAAVLPHQRAEGTPCGYRGSWDPVDPWGPDGGRVYSTAILALSLEAAGAAPPAGVAPPAPPKDPPPELKARQAELRNRASKWTVLRQNMTTTCSRCGGRRIVGRETCGLCLGRGWVFDAGLRAAYLGYRSPAARARPTAEQEFDAWYAMVWARRAASPVLQSVSVGSETLLDDTHGVVPVLENGAKPSVPTQWIWSSEPAFPKGTWYLYTEGADGPWPQ